MLELPLQTTEEEMGGLRATEQVAVTVEYTAQGAGVFWHLILRQ